MVTLIVNICGYETASLTSTRTNGLTEGINYFYEGPFSNERELINIKNEGFAFSSNEVLCPIITYSLQALDGSTYSGTTFEL